MSRHLTTRQVAEILDVTPRRVLRMAKDRNIAHAGMIANSKAWDPKDLGKFQRRKRGRPAGS